jgi:DNA helicase-2/ATP-dependent DNA helicase PcrA
LETFQNARRVTLDQNYRCTPVILEAANAVIQLNTDRLEKQLWSTRNDTERVQIYAAESAAEEALFVAETTKNLLQRGTIPNQIAVLYRSNILSKQIENAYMSLGISFNVSGGTQMSDRKEIRDLLSLVGFAANVFDLRSFLRSVEVFGYKMSLSKQEDFIEQMANEKKRVVDVCGKQTVEMFRTSLAKVTKDFDSNLYRCFVEIGDFVQALGKGESFSELASCLEHWFENSNYRKSFRSEAPSMLQVLKREETVRRFFEVVRNMNKNEGATLIQTLHERFEQKSLYSNETEDSSKVQLLTIHSSKGLEFEHVFLVGLEEGILPHERSLEEGSEQEERRLMYVAMTRAKLKLYLSHAIFRQAGKSSARSKGTNHSVRSRFLNDIPIHLVETDSVRLQSADARRAEAARRLFNMFR